MVREHMHDLTRRQLELRNILRHRNRCRNIHLSSTKHVAEDSRQSDAPWFDVKRIHWLAFAIAGGICGIAGGLFAFAKGSISPETIHVGRSIDGLVMVLLGGINSLAGPLVGAPVFTMLQDSVMRQTPYWRGVLGVIILVLVLLFPSGIAGTIAGWAKRAAR